MEKLQVNKYFTDKFFKQKLFYQTELITNKTNR